jgi:DNA sulfur modification protein DndB
MGSVEYYLTTMKAGEAVSKIRAAEQLPNWDDLSIEERMQRKIDWGRVKNEIGRFMARDPDRFFGALIVAIYSKGEMEFESLSDLKVHRLYANAAKSFGFLHLEGGEIWFALDGQHRLKGTEMAINGLDEKQRPTDFERNLDVASDELAVILIPFDPAQRARKLFNKVNKYAKQTGKGDNIITSEDDAFAIITRWLMGSNERNAVVPEPLVNWTSNTLTKRTPKFTTISALYDGAKTLIERTHNRKVDTQFRPEEETLEEYYEDVKEMWEALLGGFTIFKDAMEGPPQDLSDLREKYLCLKPAGQSAVLEAVAIARQRAMSYDDIVDGLNRIEWELRDPEWQGVIMQSAKIQAGRTPVFLAARLIAHRIGVEYSEDEQQALLREYQKAKGDDPDKPRKVKTLPERVS